MQKLIEELTKLKKLSRETVVDYLLTADDLQYTLQQVDEGVSEKMFISLILKVLPRECESFVTLVRFNKSGKSLEDIKRDLINTAMIVRRINQEMYS